MRSARKDKEQWNQSQKGQKKDHSLWVQGVVGDVVSFLVGAHLLRAVVMCATTHVHLVFLAQVMEGVCCISTTTPLCSRPRLGQLELEIRKDRRGRWCCRFCDIRCSVRVTADSPCPPIDQLALGHELVHLCERDLKRTIDPAQLLQQLLTLVIVAGMDRGGFEIKLFFLLCFGVLWLNWDNDHNDNIRKHYYGYCDSSKSHCKRYPISTVSCLI